MQCAPSLRGASSRGVLRRTALDQPGHLCWDDARERETGRRDERTETTFGALATADHEHQQFHDTNGAGTRVNYAFDEKENPAPTDSATRIAEDSRSVSSGQS
jgi:hypothetical protein